MEHEIRVSEHCVGWIERPDVLTFHREARLVFLLSKVGLAAADEIIDDADAIAAREQQIDHVAADEPSTAGHHTYAATHAAHNRFILRTL